MLLCMQMPAARPAPENLLPSGPDHVVEGNDLRRRLVSIALEWQQKFGVAPAITATLSEHDAAKLIGCPEEDYAMYMQSRTAVARCVDFVHNEMRYQVRANRPSGRDGSKVTWVPKAKNYQWDYLIWIHYTTNYEIYEAWQWHVEDYRRSFDHIKRLSPEHMRKGEKN